MPLNTTSASASAGALRAKAAAHGAPVTIWSQAISTDSAQGAISIRNLTAALSSVPVGATQIRVTFKAGSSAHFAPAHCSIGKSNGTASQTTATPLELKFSGASGFDLAANGSITSDWVDLSGLSIANSDILVVIWDTISAGHSVMHNAAASSSCYYKVSSQTYADSAPAGMTLIASDIYAAASVEART